MSLRVLNFNNKIKIGKYSELTIGEILDLDPQYLRWALDKPIIRVMPEVEIKLKEVETN